MKSRNAKIKLLVVSPVAFMPDWQGSRKRVKQMIDVMEHYGFEIHFVLIRRSDQFDADTIAMSQKLQGRFVEISDRKSESFFRPWYLRVRIASKLRLYQFCNIDADAWYFAEISRKVKEIIAREDIDILMLEYPFYSKIFDLISGVLKIIDMHDVFADRYKEFLLNGKRPVPWYSVSKADEGKSIRKADIVLAIQEGDAAIFRSYGQPNVLALSYAPEKNGPPKLEKFDKSGRLKICFLGTGNFFNINALEYYLQCIHPALLSAGINYELIVIGAVCEPFRNFRIEGNVKLLGKVADLQSELAKCDALVNALNSGTGLPIKVLDALACGLHVLATVAGVRGLPVHRNLSAVMICSETKDWIKAMQVLSQKKKDGIDLTVDAFRDLEILQKDIEISKQSLYKMIMKALPSSRGEYALDKSADHSGDTKDTKYCSRHVV